MPDQRDPNETLARLLGWEWAGNDPDPEPELWWAPDKSFTQEVPDYTDWARFPEMQEYIAVRDDGFRRLVDREVDRSYEERGEHTGRTYFTITPTILRDALLAVQDA